MSAESIYTRDKRKRKKSFLKNARKYAKKGYYGRGSELDADTYQYLVRIMESYNEGFDSEDDKIMFVNNVFEQIDKMEIDCICNQVGCRVIETLLPFANDTVLKKFMEAFNSDLRKLCKDRFASHVLEALVVISCKKSLEYNLDSKDYFKEFSLKIGKFLLNNLEDYICDTYGNHVIRTCLENLANLPKEKKNNYVETPIKSEKHIIPEEYSEVIIEYASRLLVWPQFNELCYSELTSGSFQILLRCLEKIDIKLLNAYLKKLLTNIFAPKIEEDSKDNIFPQAFLSKSIIMLLETALQVSSPKRYKQLYTKCFSGKLVKLATTGSTNFAVQKLIRYCPGIIEFETIFDELADHFEEIINAGYSGVLLSLARACKQLGAKQGNFVQNLMKSLKCFESEERQTYFVTCVTMFLKYDDLKQQSNETIQKGKLNLHGALIIQIMLDFNKPIKIINSILNTDNNVLKNLFCNCMGSHIIDSYAKGSFVGEKSKEKLVWKMAGTYQDLASAKYGSRAFEAIWSIANMKAKMRIMEELSRKDGAWSHSEHGKIIAGKINLALYKRSKEDWKNSVDKGKKAEKILNAILK